MFRRVSSVISTSSARFLSNTGDFVSRIRTLGVGNVDLDVSDPLIARVTIRNVPHKNAMTGTMMAQLSDAVDVLEKDYKGLAVVLRGAHGNFSAGLDARFVQQHIKSPDDANSWCEFSQTTLSRFKALPLISVALVEGYAVGGGAEFCLATDFRIFSADAAIQFKHAMHSISPGWGGTMLVQTVGRRRALQMLCSAEAVTGKKALEYGIADALTTSSTWQDMDTALLSFLKPYLMLAARGPGAVSAIRAAKGIVHMADCADKYTALSYEKDVFTSLWAESDTKKHAAARVEASDVKEAMKNADTPME